MPRAKTKSADGPVLLLCGEEDFAVKARAREVYEAWCEELGGMDHEIVDGMALSVGDAQKSVARLLEALNTLPFFGGGKVVWFKDCSFLGDDRTASSKTVTADLADLAKVLKDFKWGDVRLLISAGKVDKRKSFYKTVSKLGDVETFAGLSIDDRDWSDKAETIAWQHFKDAGKEPVGEALADLVASVGPNAAQLATEVEKACLYAGERNQVTVDDVEAVVVKNKQAKAFALGDALGDRDLPRLLRTLDGELWEMQFDKKKSEIGMLYGLISKVRVMLFLKEMVSEGLLRDERNYARFKSALERVPADRLPQDRRINPLAMNPYVLFRALPQSQRYTRSELVRAMDLLLQCNRRLVSTASDGALVMQHTLTEIVRGDGRQPARSR
ncbi:MAG: DNA polymerase III subunit delta [Verrucomicrobiae bacterium]|nr:DNA polymerase III subunit delta [Verrucomicrobiae bacterium]